MTIDPYDPLGFLQIPNARGRSEEPDAWYPLDSAFLLDNGWTAPSLDDSVLRTADRYLRPWRYPDPNPMPELVLFPRPHKVMRWFSR